MLAKEDLRKLVLTKDLEPLFELEECFAGGTQLAASLPHRTKQPLPPVCDQIAKLHPSRSVFGPGTFLYLSVAGIQQALQGQIGGASQTGAGRRAAGGAGGGETRGVHRGAAAGRQCRGRQQVLSQFQRQLIQVALQYGITSVPRLDDPNFVSRVVFDSFEAGGDPEGALRLPLPQQERRADHRPPAPGHDGRRASPGDRALPPGRLEPPLQAQRRQLHRHRRAGGGGRRSPGAAQPDAAPARRRRPGDGADTAPHPAAPAAGCCPWRLRSRPAR